MKGTFMRTPAASQIYSQRLQLQLHRKKLEKIRQERKSDLAFDHSRYTQIQSLKQLKNKLFVTRWNSNSSVISNQNRKLLGKLQKAKPSFQRYSASRDSKNESTQSFVTPLLKKQHFETQKQNIRISNRMRSMSSSLNKEKLNRQYQRSLEIKKRLMRFTSENNKVCLKSQKYALNISRPIQLLKTDGQKHIQQGREVNLTNHYKIQEINKNKIDSETNTLSKIRKRFRCKLEQDKVQQKNGFFTTQPNKVNQIRKRKVFL